MNQNLSGEQFWKRGEDGVIAVQPGTPIYRQEARSTSDELVSPESVGAHWTVRPVNYGYGYAPDRQQGVVWHGVVDRPEEQLVPGHRDRFNEGEVVLRHGASVRVLGRDEGDVQPVPGKPRHAMNAVVPVRRAGRS